MTEHTSNHRNNNGNNNTNEDDTAETSTVNNTNHQNNSNSNSNEEQKVSSISSLSSAALCMRFSIRMKTTTTAEEEEEVEEDTDNNSNKNITDTDADNCYEFHPVYTHQIFPSECIPNFRPLLLSSSSSSSSPEEDATESTIPLLLLLIHVRLLPSCVTCELEILVSVPSSSSSSTRLNNDDLHQQWNNNDIMPPELGQSEQMKKKQKMASSVDDTTISNSRIVMEIMESIRTIKTTLRSFLPPIRKCTTRIQQTHESPLRQLGNGGEVIPAKSLHVAVEVEEVCNVIDRSLSTSPSLQFLTRPYGTILHEYSTATTTTDTATADVDLSSLPTTKSNDHDKTFCITICNGVDCATYFNESVQKLAFYFIETASDFNVNDPSWKVLFLYRKHSCHPTSTATTTPSTDEPDTQSFYSLVGYMTLYYFATPFRKPIPGTIVRICQVLILPPYQRQQHGQQLLHTLFNHYFGDHQLYPPNDDDTTTTTTIVEINVEDPVPAFAHLRLLVDYERLLRSRPHWFATTSSSSSSSSNTTDILDESFFTVLDNSKRLTHIQSLSKTTTVQIQMIYEIDKLRQLHRYVAHRKETILLHSGNNNDINNSNISNSTERDVVDLLQRRYRLMVKQRLYEQNKEELDQLQLEHNDNKKKKKEQLDIMFHQLLQQYERIILKTSAASAANSRP